MDEIDIWRTAAEMIRQFGAVAEVTAAKRSGAFADHGDIEGAAVWVRVTRAIAELQRKTPASPTH
jgi:hypothetical protein